MKPRRTTDEQRTRAAEIEQAAADAVAEDREPERPHGPVKARRQDPPERDDRE